MSIFGDGFLPYHFDVYVETGASEKVKEAIKTWQTDFRFDNTWSGFPETMVEKLEALPGVTRVEEEGPQSAVLIPLRMIHGITGKPCIMSAVLGEGEVSRAIKTKCENWEIELQPSRIKSGSDSPIECSIREPGGASTSLRIYPTSRKSYSSTLRKISQMPDHMILTRHNKGMVAIAHSVFSRGGIVSMRIRNFGRYDRVEDYIDLLPFTKHLVLSSRNNVLRVLSQSAGIEFPRKWPTGLNSLISDIGLRFAEWLLNLMPKNGTVVFTLESTHETVFFRKDSEPIGIRPPKETCPVSRVARLQGALLGAELLCSGEQEKFKEGAAWESYYRHIMADAFDGAQEHPWIYPDYSISPKYADNEMRQDTVRDTQTRDGCLGEKCQDRSYTVY